MTMELGRIDPGDVIDLPFWPGRITVEAITCPRTYCRSASLIRLFWVATDGAEGVTTVSDYTQVHRAGRFTDYATLPEYVPWSRVYALLMPPEPDADMPAADDALAELRDAMLASVPHKPEEG